jgi:hypothetical protein
LVVLHLAINEHAEGAQFREIPSFTESSKGSSSEDSVHEIVAILDRASNKVDLVTQGSSSLFCREVGIEEFLCTLNRFSDKGTLSLIGVVSELFGEPVDEQVALLSVEFSESSCGDVIEPLSIHVLGIDERFGSRLKSTIP